MKARRNSPATSKHSVAPTAAASDTTVALKDPAAKASAPSADFGVSTSNGAALHGRRGKGGASEMQDSNGSPDNRKPPPQNGGTGSNSSSGSAPNQGDPQGTTPKTPRKSDLKETADGDTITSEEDPDDSKKPQAAAPAPAPPATADPTARMTRKRKAKEQSSKSSSSINSDDPTRLIAVDKRGREYTVKMVLAHQPYVLGGNESPPNTKYHERLGSTNSARVSRATTSAVGLGQDGNQYYCQVCRGFGDVVCCDACPRVYHHECVPLQSPSRKSLDNDDDPWYCPECIGESKRGAKSSAKPAPPSTTKKPRRGTGAQKTATEQQQQAPPIGDRRATSQHRCSDCEQSRPYLGLAPCKGCGAYVHSPTCRTDAEAVSSSKRNKVFCLNCQAIDQEDDERNSDDKEHGADRNESTGDYPEDEGGGGGSHRRRGSDEYVDDGAGKKKRSKRKKTLSPNHQDSEKKRKKKKKKKRRRSLSLEKGGDDRARRHDPEQDRADKTPRKTGMVQATPAFVFYLAECRWKIEKALARKHRTFNRLPKGEERNALVATEAMEWWSELPDNERTRYIEMSMRDFEARIIQWKQAKIAREMQAVEYPSAAVAAGTGGGSLQGGDGIGDAAREADDILTYEKHERLYLSTSVGSKPFKLEPDQSYNRVLLDLLHDIRFHPLPMFCVNRAENDTAVDEHSNKVTIPYFEVHGPISTSIGDECLGCSRGWTHFCPVLQRRIPAVEHRAKLQPPMSSLMATRVGLGLRLKPTPPQPPNIDVPDVAVEGEPEVEPDVPQAELFQFRESDLTREMKRLPVVQNYSAFDPTDRGDDIVQFIEETVAMKIPEPPRPAYPDTKSQQKKSARTLPTSRTRVSAEENRDKMVYSKCGRCRTIIFNDTGCVQCRRAQLVINKSKKVAPGSSKSGDGSKALKVHTAMLSRVQMKEMGPDRISKEDVDVAEAILKVRWCPSAILPPHVTYVPKPGSRLGESDVSLSSGEEIADDESAETNGDSKVAAERPVQEEAVEKQPTPEKGTPPAAEKGEKAEEQAVDEPQVKRQRSTRVLSMMFKEAVTPANDRQQVLKHHKKETSELQKKTVQIACDSILLALMRRDPLHLFARPVTADGYRAAIRNPIDFGKIRDNVLAGKYTSIGTFCSDARLLCENALAYNPPSSIYFKTAKEMHSALAVMQKRASDWMAAIKKANTNYLHSKEFPKRNSVAGGAEAGSTEDDPWAEMRKVWPEAVNMLENGDSYHKRVQADFMRTKENETAFYGTLAVRRVAMATEASLAPYTDSGGIHTVVAKRRHFEDAELRDHVDSKVAAIDFPQLKSVSAWREEAVVRLVRKVQKLRVERKTGSEHGCSRCDGAVIDKEAKAAALNADLAQPIRPKRKGDHDMSRVVESRVILATGLGSAKTCQRIVNRTQETSSSVKFDSVSDACVSVRGSKVHGMGLFADQPFKKGEVVAEYIGEYVANPVADQREKVYGEQRIQDYQFRLDDKYVIDATLKGGAGRYINHNCTPNCSAKIIPGEPPNQHLRRVMIIAQRAIDLNEEISYDYQFPLEMDLGARIPCNCLSDACRGFMNWDLPEKGSNNRALLVQKRGANMRDRIRRLNRPLKRDEAMD